MASVFIGVPTYDQLASQALPGLMLATQRHRYHIRTESGSLLALMFNFLWCRALNARAEGITHFAMHHADIEAEPGWLDVLLDELERTGADVLSAVVPIKDNRGVTSTGHADPATHRIRRLTMHEVQRLPETFGPGQLWMAGKPASDYLMVNTGLWVCNLTRPWAEEVCFTVQDAITRDGRGRFWPRCVPEDWGFSFWLQQRGLRVLATRKVKVIHHGRAGYANDRPWGEWETDKGDYE
jgi:hypothetical protein